MKFQNVIEFLKFRRILIICAVHIRDGILKLRAVINFICAVLRAARLYIRAVWIIQSASKFNCQIPKNLDEAFTMPPKIGRLVEFHFLEFLKIILLLAI